MTWILSSQLFLLGVLITIHQGEVILQETNLYPNWIVNDHKYNYSLPWKQIVLDKGKSLLRIYRSAGSTLLSSGRLRAVKSCPWVRQDEERWVQEATAEWNIITSQPVYLSQPPLSRAHRTQNLRPAYHEALSCQPWRLKHTCLPLH